MAEEKSEKRAQLNYHVIITGVNEDKLSQAIPELARYFTLDAGVAEQILKSPPIVFLSNINRDELKTLKPRLIELSNEKLGLEFTITTKLSATIPRVVWPNQPHYKDTPGGEIVRYTDFQWRGNAFVCPNCGETFVFRRMGNPFARYLKIKEGGAAGVSESRVLSKVEAPVSAESPIVELEPVPEEIEEDEVIEPDETKATGTEVSPEAEPDAPVMELTPMGEEGAETQAAGATGDIIELAPVKVEEVEAVEEEVPEPIDILPPTPEEVESQAQPAEEVVEAPEIVEEPQEAEANCTLFLSKITSAEKKEAAVKLIAEIKDISTEKAQRITKRVLIPILKDVTEAEAQEALEKFKEIGIGGRITKKPI